MQQFALTEANIFHKVFDKESTVLSEELCRALEAFFKTPHDFSNFKGTQWEHAVFCWNWENVWETAEQERIELPEDLLKADFNTVTEEEGVKSLYTKDENISGGIFWIKNPDDIAGSAICVERTNDSNRWRHVYENNAVFVEGISHKEIWEQLPETETNGEEYNCYPRGRVHIKNGAATIYANPNICTEELKTFITETFRLYPQFHISEVRMKADGSKHYEYYSDRKEKTEWKMQKKQ